MNNWGLLLGNTGVPKQAAEGRIPEITIMPHRVQFMGMEVGASVIVGWAVTIVLLVLLVIGYFRIRTFTEKPKGAQKFIEFLVESMYGFARGKIGEYADSVAPVALALMCYIALGTLVELFGLPPLTEDLSATLGLGLVTFLTVNFTALKNLGLKTRLKKLASPNPVVFPIKVLADMLAPISMALRLFANVLVGGIIMKLVYAVLPVLLPVPIAAYFNVVHVAIQVYVFGMLTLSYVSEAIE